MAHPRKIEVSHRTIVFTAFFLIFLWFLYQIREIILAFFVALLIMAILNPTVTTLSKFKVPRVISALIAYVLGFALVGVAVAGIVPPLIEQTTGFVNNLPYFLQNLALSSVLGEQIIGEVLSQIGGIPGQVAKFSVSVFSNVLGVFTVLIFAFYLLLLRDKLDDQLGFLFGDRKKEIGKIIDLMEKRLGSWARGQLALMFLVGASTYIGLRLLSIPFSLPLAILAGLLEVVPYIGPIISAIPAVIIGFGIAPIMGLATAALYFLIQQVENYVFVPKVMEKSVGLSPIVILLALAIGFKIAGIAGILISIPVVITIQVLSKEYLLSK